MRTVDSSEEKNNLNFLGKLDAPAILAIFTVLTWYFVTHSTEMFYKSIGLTEQYVDYPFFNLVKSAEPLFVIVVPSVIFFVLFVIALGNRLLIEFYYKSDDSIEMFEDSNIKRMRNIYTFTAVVLWCVEYLKLGDRLGISQLDSMIFISSITITINSIFLIYSVARISDIPYSTKIERVFNRMSLWYASLVIYGLILLVALQFYSASQPYTMLISEESIKCEDGFCDFEYLVSDKNGYSAWSKLSYRIPRIENDKENRIYLFNSERSIESRSMMGKTMFEVDVDRELRIHETIGKDGEEMDTLLYFDDWEELKKQMNYNFREDLFVDRKAESNN